MKISALALSLTLLALLLLNLTSQAQSDEIIQTKGKEFWIGFMKNYDPQVVSSLDIFISSDQNTIGTVSLPANGWSQSFVVNANVTTTVTVPNDIAETLTFGAVDDTGILVETDDTVAVFAINFKEFTADGMRVLPVGALGTEYRVSAYQGLEGVDYNSEMLIVATADNTEIEIIPGCNLSGGQQQGVLFTINLDRGESYQLKAQSWSDEVTGSLIRATEASGPCRPFAVFSGSDCTNIPYGCTACDHICEQNLPTASWGTRYFLIPFNLANSYTYKILAHEDGTIVNLNGIPVGLDAGEYAEYNDVDDVICVESNLPVSAIQFMEGLDCGGAGDPAMLILDDANQGIQSITFSTVESTIITNHNINVIVSSSDIGGVSLDGALIPNSEFSPVTSCPDFAYAQISLNEGSHTLIAPSGVTGYVYGTGEYESYAYSVGSFKFSPGVIVDSVLCETDTDTVLIGINGDYGDIYWFNTAFPDDTLGSGNQFVLYPPVASGIYVGIGSEFANGCAYQETFNIEIENAPLSVSLTDLQVCQFQTVEIAPVVTPFNPNYQYQWTPSFGLSNDQIANPEITAVETTMYYLEITSPGGCNSAMDSVLVNTTDGTISNFEVTPTQAALCMGDTLQLDANFEVLTFFDYIDSAIDPAKWENLSGASASQLCGSVNQDAVYFNSPFGTERSITTVPMDVSQGGTVHFLLKIANGLAPCEDADPGENVLLQYSTGGAFTTFFTCDESLYPDFTEMAISIPLAAYSPTTRFKWIQPTFSAVNEDNWAMDQIYITRVNYDPNSISWSPSTGLNDSSIPDPIAIPDASVDYTFTVNDGINSCSYSQQVSVIVYEMPDINLGPDITVCDYNDVLLQATDNNGLNNVTYQWEPEYLITSPNSQTTTLNEQGIYSQLYTVTAGNNAICVVSDDIYVTLVGNGFGLGSDITQCELFPANIVLNFFDFESIIWSTGESGTSIEVDESGTYWVSAVSGDCLLNDTIQVTFEPVPIVDLGPDIAICPNEIIVLDAGLGGSNYVWNDESDSQFFEVTEPGTYSVTVFDDSFQCSDFDEITISQAQETSVDIGSDPEICEGEFVILDAGIEGADYLWNTGETTQAIVVSNSGVYSVEVNANGCVGEDEVMVNVYQIPVFDLGDDLVTCDDISLTLNPGDAYPDADYFWSSGETSPSVTLDQEGTYWCLIENGPCAFADTITFVPTAFDPELKMPNVFTPDGDGKNDFFGPEAKDLLNYSLKIINRWGKTIFESVDYDEGWNGRYNGNEMASGTYYYVLAYEEKCSGLVVETGGSFTLLRPTE